MLLAVSPNEEALINEDSIEEANIPHQIVIVWIMLPHEAASISEKYSLNTIPRRGGGASGISLA